MRVLCNANTALYTSTRAQRPPSADTICPSRSATRSPGQGRSTPALWPTCQLVYLPELLRETGTTESLASAGKKARPAAASGSDGYLRRPLPLRAPGLTASNSTYVMVKPPAACQMEHAPDSDLKPLLRTRCFCIWRGTCAAISVPG